MKSTQHEYNGPVWVWSTLSTALKGLTVLEYLSSHRAAQTAMNICSRTHACSRNMFQWLIDPM